MTGRQTDREGAVRYGGAADPGCGAIHTPASCPQAECSDISFPEGRQAAADADVGTIPPDPAPGSATDGGPEDGRAVAYCRVRTGRDTRYATKAAYEGLLQDRDRYDLFIDGMTREAHGRDGAGRSRCAKLTVRELGLLAEYIEAARPMRPRATKTGARCLSDLAAVKLFEKARAKVDVKLGRYEYRAFRLHRNPAERSLKAYEFAPPKAFRYCLILPV